MSLWMMIDDVIATSRSQNPKTIARKLVQQLTTTELVSLIAEEIAHRQRIAVRNVEVRVFRSRFSGDAVVSMFGDDFQRLLGLPLKLGDATPGLTFGSATAEQHLQRIEMLTKLRNGIDETIERHCVAIQMIESAGVECLNDLDEAVA